MKGHNWTLVATGRADEALIRKYSDALDAEIRTILEQYRDLAITHAECIRRYNEALDRSPFGPGKCPPPPRDHT